MSRIHAPLRNHIHFLVIMPLIIILMTWPTFYYVLDSDVFWLPSKSTDLFFKIWDVWYARQVLEGRADFLFTDLQFYPRGMSLVFHQISIPHAIAVALLQAVMPMSNAINLGYLLLLFANAASTYILLLLVFRNKWISLFGAVVVGLNPGIAFRGTLPDLSLMAAIPWSIYFFLRSINEQRLRFALFAGFAASVSAFVSMFMFVCTLLTLGIYGCFLALSRWKRRRFWLQIAILLCAFSSVSMIRMAPMIVDRDSFAEALEKGADVEVSSDLLGFFASPFNPAMSPLLASAIGTSPDKAVYGAYPGYTPLLLLLLGFARRSLRRKMFPWLIILMVFLLLRLGDTLTINAVQYPNVLLPKRVFDQALPILFSPFWYPDGWQAGAVLSLAVLACYGLSAVAQLVSKSRAAWLIMALIALTSFEYYASLDSRVIDESQLKFIEWLKTEEQDSIRLINLPMGRSNSKIYSFYQSIAGYPTVEGVANRTLSESYSYIDAHPLLSKWRKHAGIYCMPANANAINEALDQLYADGFTHIAVHQWLPQSIKTPIRYLRAKPAYEDDFVTIYRLQDLLDSCQHSAFLSGSILWQLKDVLPRSAIRLGDRATVVAIHPAEGANDDMNRFYSRIFESQSALIPLTVDDVARSLPQRCAQESEVERKLFQNSFVLSVYDPLATAPGLAAAYTDWISSCFISCGQVARANPIHVEVFAKKEILCDLLTADNPLAVVYYNGMKLANALIQFDGEQLNLYLLWERLGRQAHSVSLQIFDAAGTKIQGLDSVIPHDPTSNMNLDLSSLAPGDYVAKLILYNYETGHSVSGAVSGTDTWIDRELEIARLTID